MWAGIRFLTRMRSSMRYQVITASEAFVTDGASVGTDIAVCPLMAFQLIHTSKPFFTAFIATDKLFLLSGTGRS